MGSLGGDGGNGLDLLLDLKLYMNHGKTSRVVKRSHKVRTNSSISLHCKKLDLVVFVKMVDFTPFLDNRNSWKKKTSVGSCNYVFEYVG